MNNKESLVFDTLQLKFIKKKWKDIKSGELVKTLKDEEFAADMVLLKSEKETGIAYVDTMNLDGEVSFISMIILTDKFEGKGCTKRAGKIGNGTYTINVWKFDM